ncbi:hypothetical protein KJ742_01220 [Patescibacteria group bacterium]|nr:hypothetical protein [Patescibacteria group bacterium]MBU1682545.1 hypothetical protein [Patescibacteria group bacterium]MBU1934897.1 hypothetical protein [Patescibacteria group bacterium]
MDNKLLKTVWEELVYLTNDWNAQNKSDANLRRLSASLRTLLIDSDLKLFQVAKKIGIPLRILVDSELDLLIPGTVLRQTSGGKHNGLKIASFSKLNRALSNGEAKRLSTPRARKKKPIKLSIFLKLPSITINGIDINKEDVIKYVANKLGGCHFDPKRKESHKNGKLTLEGKYAILDEHRKLKLADKDAVYFDLLSTGQKLIQSRDIQKLKKKIQKILKTNNTI